MTVLRSIRFFHCTGAVLILALGTTSMVYAQITYRPGQEYRSLNTDYYQFAIQKNGRIDVALSSGQSVFLDAFPMVRFEGKRSAEALKVDGRWSQRYEVDDALGRGNGMLLKYKNCEWTIRAYPSKPFFAVQVAFINTTKKPVAVSELMPWCVGDPYKGALTLGEGSKDAPILTNALDGGDAGLLRGEARSETHLAVFNPANGRSVIAGFLTQTMAMNSISLSASRKKKQDLFDQFRAVCTFDPPVVIEPGGRLNSEVLYVALAETNPLEGLERYARAIAVAHGISAERTFIPHGWVVSGDALNEAAILSELDFMASKLKPYGLKHVSLGQGWQRAVGDWEPDASRFPSGLKSLVDEIHARGLTAGIWLDPFLVDVNLALAYEHSEWLLERAGDDGDGPLRVLDITAPGAAEHVRQIGVRVREWGFDAIEGVNTRVLVEATGYLEGARTRVEVARAGMVSLLDGFGQDRFAATSTPSLLSAPFFDGASLTISSSARSNYFAPHLWVPIPEAGNADSRNTWALTELALLGGAVQFTDLPSRLSSEHRDALRRILPTPQRGARILDLLYDDSHRVWALQVDSAIGRWVVVAVFNRDQSESARTTLPFSALNLSTDDYYAVYDFWEERYYGTARGTLDVDVGPGSVRVFALRPYRDRPMFLSTDAHITQGATDLTALNWDGESRRLSGAFRAVENTEYNLSFLVPEGYEVKEISSSLESVPSEREGRVLRLKFSSPRSESVTWSIQF